MMSTSSSLPFLPAFPPLPAADLSSYGKKEVTFTVQSRWIGFRQRVHSACTGALIRAFRIRPSTIESNEPTTLTSAPSSTPTISSPMPLGAGKVASISLLCPGREATCATETAHGESSVRAIVQSFIAFLLCVLLCVPRVLRVLFSFPDNRPHRDGPDARRLRVGDRTARSGPPARRCRSCRPAVATIPSW